VGSYYYFVAQLPVLIYGQEPPMSSSAFRELARGQMSAGDAALLAVLSLDPRLPGPSHPDRPVYAESGGPSYAEASPATDCEFIDQWRDWERALRLNLARLRASRIKREGGAPVDPPVIPADAAGAAQQALAVSESPLEAEMLLDKARWSAIEQFQGITYFDRNTIYAYLLKLLIMERYASFKAETGFAEYKSLYASILENAGAGESK
jgi:hypothetical protein